MEAVGPEREFRTSSATTVPARHLLHELRPGATRRSKRIDTFRLDKAGTVVEH